MCASRSFPDIRWSKKPARLPVVMTREEVKRVLEQMEGVKWMLASMLYGSGMRLMECLRLRVKDVDFGYGQIVIRNAKGQKDRVTMLPLTLAGPLERHLNKVRLIHRRDRENGFGRVFLPTVLCGKYPNADSEWAWQWVFPAGKLSRDPRTGITRRHHIDESALQKAVKKAVRAAGITKQASCHTYSGIRLPPICWRTAMTSGRCRNCWDTRTSRPP